MPLYKILGYRLMVKTAWTIIPFDFTNSHEARLAALSLIRATSVDSISLQEIRQEVKSTYATIEDFKA